MKDVHNILLSCLRLLAINGVQSSLHTIEMGDLSGYMMPDGPIVSANIASSPSLEPCVLKRCYYGYAGRRSPRLTLNSCSLPLFACPHKTRDGLMTSEGGGRKKKSAQSTQVKRSHTKPTRTKVVAVGVDFVSSGCLRQDRELFVLPTSLLSRMAETRNGRDESF